MTLLGSFSVLISVVDYSFCIQIDLSMYLNESVLFSRMHLLLEDLHDRSVGMTLIPGENKTPLMRYISC